MKIDEDVSLVCAKMETQIPSSQEGFLGSRSQDRYATASVRSHHAPLLWTRASASAFNEVSSKRRLDTIVVTSIEQYNFVQKHFSALLCQYNITSQFFKEIQDF